MSDPTSTTAAACGCCPPQLLSTPQPVVNRAGLPEVAYRCGTWRQFRATMQSDLSAARGALAELRTRDDADPTVALLDAWAVVCDVLTFYNERLAQESYLNTAVEPVSLQELGKLIGYVPDPGVAAETDLAFTLERPPIVPALSTDPGLAPPTTPEEIALPTGLRVQSIPGPGESPQTFETVDEIDARPEWSSMPVARTVAAPVRQGDVSAWFLGTTLNLQAGAAVLISGRTPATTDFVNDRWDFRLLTRVEIDRRLNTTAVDFEWPLGSFVPPNTPAAEPAAHVLRQRLKVFGHNAPVWPTLDVTYRSGYAASRTGHRATQESIIAASEWHGFDSTSLSGSSVILDLDGAHADVVTGSWVVVSQEDGTFYRELYEVVGRAELSRAEFGISGTVTRLTLRGEYRRFGSPRQVTVFAVSEPLTLTERPDRSEVSGNDLIVDGDASDMAPGRKILVSTPTIEGAAEAGVVEQVRAWGVSPSGEPRTRITLVANLLRHFDRLDTVVLGNVVTATHGETVHEILGGGDARRPWQKFALTQGPLTFVQAPSAEGSASTLHISVDSVEWPEAATHFEAAPGEWTFTHTRSAEINPATDQPYDVANFGDGTHAARVTTGSNNVQARYRKGLGSAGNLAANRLAQPLDRPLGLKAATNPLPAGGGADPEPPDRARRSMPVSVRTLGRAVSLADYADFSLAFSGISRATARVLSLRSGRTVVVTVSGPDAGPAAPSTISHLRTALIDLGDPLVRVEVVAARPVPVRLALRVGVDPAYSTPDVIGTVDAALLAGFAPAVRDLGGVIPASAVIATAQLVPGVVGVDLDRFYREGAGGSRLNDRLFGSVATIGPTGTPLGAELLGLTADPFDWLEPMT